MDIIFHILIKKSFLILNKEKTHGAKNLNYFLIII